MAVGRSATNGHVVQKGDEARKRAEEGEDIQRGEASLVDVHCEITHSSSVRK